LASIHPQEIILLSLNIDLDGPLAFRSHQSVFDLCSMKPLRGFLCATSVFLCDSVVISRGKPLTTETQRSTKTTRSFSCSARCLAIQFAAHDPWAWSQPGLSESDDRL